MSKISEFFTWEEALVTNQRDPKTGLVLSNQPGPETAAQLVHTFQRMDGVRGLLGKPVRVHSAYRSPAVNAAVGGSPTSQHCGGQAVDFSVPGLTVREVFGKLRGAVEYDQLIEEAGTWVHISFVHDARTPRRQALTMTVKDGKAHYAAA